MRRDRALLVLLAAAAVPLQACASGAPDVFGRQVTLVPTERHAPKVKGELLAAQDGRVWVRTKDGGVRDFAASTLAEVQVRRHEGGGDVRKVGLIGGLLSMVALTAACSSVEGNDAGGCLAISGFVGGVFAATGALSGAGLDSSSRLHASPGDATLRRYARFPAGLPAGVPPEWLLQPPATPKPKPVE